MPSAKLNFNKIYKITNNNQEIIHIGTVLFILVYKIPLLSNATAMKASYQQCRSAIYEAVSSVTIF